LINSPFGSRAARRPDVHGPPSRGIDAESKNSTRFPRMAPPCSAGRLHRLTLAKGLAVPPAGRHRRVEALRSLERARSTRRRMACAPFTTLSTPRSRVEGELHVTPLHYPNRLAHGPQTLPEGVLGPAGARGPGHPLERAGRAQDRADPPGAGPAP